MRIGNLYGPDATFLGVPGADPDVAVEWSGAGAVVIGAPFDGGTSHRPGCRFGPQAIRTTDYLPHDGQRPSLALGVDPLVDLAVVDLGDVELPSGATELSQANCTDVAAALHDSDEALYEAKENGRNRLVVRRPRVRGKVVPIDRQRAAS